MRILFVTDNFPPEVNAPARRTYEHCVEWVREGAEVTVLTCWPNFPGGEVYEGYRNKLFGRTDTDGIRVVRLWSYISRNEGFLRRVVDYLSFAFMAFWAGLFRRFDVVVATSPQFFTTFTAFGLSLFRRKPWIFELRDIWPESISAVGAMRQGRMLRLLERIELSLYRHSARVLAVTPAFRDNLASRGIAPAHVAVVPNGVHRSAFPEVPKDAALLESLELENCFVVGYVGTHGLAHGLDFIVRCAAHAEDSALHFLFIGDGAEKQKIVSLARDLSLDNVTFLDPVAGDEVHRYLSVTDVALVPLRRSDTFKSVIPSKIFESAAMAKPILLGVEGQARAIVEEFDAGQCFEPENESDFLQKLSTLASDAALYERHQQGCRRLAEHYDRRRLALEALTVIQQVADRRQSS